MPALQEHLARDGFRLRGLEASRIDSFSDVIFGFALTLLVVSLEVPHTFNDLNRSLRDFVPFAVCFFILLQVWYAHYAFFRRFGVHDPATIFLNTLLLFVVLYYVYPMKFLFTVLANGWLHHQSGAFGTGAQMRELMLLYGTGFASIFFLYTALYWNAYRQADALELTSRERLLTRSFMWNHGLDSGVGLLSCLSALLLPPRYVGLAGLAYLMLIVVGRGHALWMHRTLRRLDREALPAGV